MARALKSDTNVQMQAMFYFCIGNGAHRAARRTSVNAIGRGKSPLNAGRGGGRRAAAAAEAVRGTRATRLPLVQAATGAAGARRRLVGLADDEDDVVLRLVLLPLLLDHGDDIRIGDHSTHP